MDRITDYKLNIETIDRDEDKYPERSNHTIVEAQYTARAGITDNPDLCALPNPVSAEKLLELCTIPIPYYNSTTAKNAPIYERLDQIILMQNAFAPLAHIHSYQKALDDALTSAYISSSLWTYSENIDSEPVDGSAYKVINRHLGPNSRPLSFAVTGVTGCGKTVALKTICSLYPEAIHHVLGLIEYTQIPIIAVTALVGNMSELFLSIGKKIDEIMGHGPIWENKVRKARSNNGLAASVIKDAIKVFHIGLIIVDEAQFLKFDGSNASLEHLIGISEETHCALGFIGNREMRAKMMKYPRFESRVMLNSIDISSTEATSKVFFENAISFLWTYQFTKEETKLTEDIRAELCNASMYNIALLKNLLMRVQYEAVIKYPPNGITAEYIHNISEQYFSVIQAMLLNDTTANERAFYDALKKNTDTIIAKSASLKAKANTNAINAQMEITKIWGAEKYNIIVFCAKEMYSKSVLQINRALTALLKKDPMLPDLDVGYIVDQVKRFIDSSVETKRDSQKSAKKTREVDTSSELAIHNALSAPLKGITSDNISG